MQVDLYLPTGRQLVFWRVRIWRSLRMNRGLHCPSIDAGDWIPHNNSGINCHSFIFLFIFSLFLSFSLFFSPFPPSVLHALNRNEQQSTIGRLQGGGFRWMDGWIGLRMKGEWPHCRLWFRVPIFSSVSADWFGYFWLISGGRSAGSSSCKYPRISGEISRASPSLFQEAQ